MNYAKLGQTGMEVSRITFGCWELGGGMWEKAEDEVNIKLLQTRQGVNSFDTAEGYGDGHSEKIVGLALDGKRKECFLATKVSKANLRRDDLRRAVENSLKRLRTDYLDLYYVHWPNPEIPLQETMTEMNRLKERIIRHWRLHFLILVTASPRLRQVDDPASTACYSARLRTSPSYAGNSRLPWLIATHQDPNRRFPFR